jgi:sigma-B regulation protein RsbQ
MSAVDRHAVRVRGTGDRTVLFAHGYGCDQDVWNRVAPGFERDFRVVTFDYVGAGRADMACYDPHKYATLDGYADDLLAICDELQLRDAIFVGHSVSAMIGVLAAIRAPGMLERLVMIGPSPCYVDHEGYRGGFSQGDIEELLGILDSNFVSWSATMAPVIMNAPDRPELAQELARNFCRIDPAVARQFARVTFLSDCRAQLPLLRQSVLILQCAEDAIAPVAVGEYMQRTMAASRLVLMRAKGHCPHVSAPDETIAAIRSFL